MLFGVFLPQMKFTYQELLRQFQDAEEAGFDSAWLMDHLISEGKPEWDCLEGWTVASALATQTQRIRLGHLVLCNGFRNPAVLAKMAATLDQITEGRLDLGLGWGSVPRELKVYGCGIETAAVRAARLDEGIQIMKLIFGGGPATFDGEHYSIYKAYGKPRPVNGTIPIMIGGAGPKLTLPLVAKHADWWNCPANAVGDLTNLLPRIGNARVSVQHIIGIAPSSAKRVEVAETAQKRFGFWGGGIVTGTPDEIIESLLEDKRLGVEKIIFRFSDFGDPISYKLFFDEIAPALR